MASISGDDGLSIRSEGLSLPPALPALSGIAKGAAAMLQQQQQQKQQLQQQKQLQQQQLQQQQQSKQQQQLQQQRDAAAIQHVAAVGGEASSLDTAESADTVFKGYELLWRRVGTMPAQDMRTLVGELYGEKNSVDFFHDNTDRPRLDVGKVLVQLAKKRDRNMGAAPAYLRCLLESARAHLPADKRFELFALVVGMDGNLRPCLCDLVLDLVKGVVLMTCGQVGRPAAAATTLLVTALTRGPADVRGRAAVRWTRCGSRRS